MCFYIFVILCSTPTRYAYSDTLIGSTVKHICEGLPSSDVASAKAEACSTLQTLLDERRAKYPVVTWEDTLHGRTADWTPDDDQAGL